MTMIFGTMFGANDNNVGSINTILCLLFFRRSIARPLCVIGHPTTTALFHSIPPSPTPFLCSSNNRQCRRGLRETHHTQPNISLSVSRLCGHSSGVSYVYNLPVYTAAPAPGVLTYLQKQVASSHLSPDRQLLRLPHRQGLSLLLLLLQLAHPCTNHSESPLLYCM